MRTLTLHFSFLMLANFALMAVLMFSVIKSVLILTTSSGNPLVSSIPVLAGISFFYIFDNFGKLLRLTDGIEEREVAPLLQFCSGRFVSSFVLVTLVTLVPALVR